MSSDSELKTSRITTTTHDHDTKTHNISSAQYNFIAVACSWHSKIVTGALRLSALLLFFLTFYFPFIEKYNLSKGRDMILNSLHNLSLSTLI